MTTKQNEVNIIFRLLLFHGILIFCWSPSAFGAELHLALADSTCAAMQKAGTVFTENTGISLSYTCKSSGLLAKGIRAGIIKADFFLSANKKWLDSLIESGHIAPENVTPLLSNELIVVSPLASSTRPSSLNDLTSQTIKKIIIGDPSRAPFGRYAKQALQNAGIWTTVLHKITTRKNISLAIQSIKEEEEGTVCILYRTGMEPTLRLNFRIPQGMNEAILYYSGPLEKSASKKSMDRFISFLKGENFRIVFQDAGFIVSP